MLLKMAHVQIIGMHPQLNATISALHRLGVLHIESIPQSSALKRLLLDGSSLQLQERLKLLAARLDSLIKTLPDETEINCAHTEQNSAAGTDLINAGLDEIAPKVQVLMRRRDDLQAEAVSLPRYEATLAKLAPLSIALPPLNAHETAALLIDNRYRDVLDLMNLEIKAITGDQCEMVAQDVDEHTIAALLIYPSHFAGEIQSILGQENITQVRLPRELSGQTFHDTLVALHQRQNAIEQELATITEQMREIAKRWRARLLAWRREVKNRLNGLSVRAQFGTTNYTFIIQGWLPRCELSRLRETLGQAAGEQVIVNELDTQGREGQGAPVVFANHSLLKPFEMLVRLNALPRQGGFDPTLMLGIFLPLFFGMILGDVGLGLLLLILAYYCRRRFAGQETVRDLAQILIYGAVWAVIFGFCYGEFFGSLGESLGLHPLWMPREGKYLLSLFLFSLTLGVVQVTIGLLLAFWEAWREKQTSEMLRKAGMLVVLAALFAIVGVTADYLPRQFFTPTVVALLVGMAILIVPAGLMGLILAPLEVIETVGNILSYLRLAAIGMASVYLALVANEIAGVMGNMLVGVIAAVLLHALNFALGIFSPMIQSLRLQYVEFFRHFYRGGGEPFSPFKLE